MYFAVFFSYKCYTWISLVDGVNEHLDPVQRSASVWFVHLICAQLKYDLL